MDGDIDPTFTFDFDGEDDAPWELSGKLQSQSRVKDGFTSPTSTQSRLCMQLTVAKSPSCSLLPCLNTLDLSNTSISA